MQHLAWTEELRRLETEPKDSPATKEQSLSWKYIKQGKEAAHMNSHVSSFRMETSGAAEKRKEKWMQKGNPKGPKHRNKSSDSTQKP